MFDVGFSELMVIGVVALLVIGPEKLPRVAKMVGALLGRAQRYVNDVKADINREIELDELKKIQTTVQDAAHSIQASVNETMSTFESQAAELNSLASGTAPTAKEAAVATVTDATPPVTAPVDSGMQASLPLEMPAAMPEPVAANVAVDVAVDVAVGVAAKTA